jgi:hypothetical protein
MFLLLLLLCVLVLLLLSCLLLLLLLGRLVLLLKLLPLLQHLRQMLPQSLQQAGRERQQLQRQL